MYSPVSLLNPTSDLGGAPQIGAPNFYTYLWLRENGTPYYVGKGTEYRAFKSNRHLVNCPPRERIIVQSHASEQDAIDAEKFLIAFYGRVDLGTGCLRNQTDGGDGASGKRHSVETKAKMSLAHKGLTWIRRKETQPRKPRPHFSEEWRRKLSEAHKGNKNNSGKKHKPRTPEYLQRLSEGVRRSWIKRRQIMAYSPSLLLNPLADAGGIPELGSPILYVVRHAQNDDDANGRIRGLKDQPLNETGEKQLRGLKAFFSDRPVLGVWTDDLSRTKATAIAIAGVCGCGVETDIGLRSWDVGSRLEGRSMAAHKLEIQDFKTHPAKVPVGGQSWGDFEQEVSAAIDRAIRRAMESSGPICIVTHGSVIQLFMQRYGDWDEHADYDHTPLDQAGVAALYLTRNGMETKILKGAKADKDE